MFWMFEATAEAAEGCTFPPGGRHALLAFVAGPDRDAAQARMLVGVAAHGWAAVELRRSGAFEGEVAAIADETLRAAAEGAVAGRCAIVAYPDPIGDPVTCSPAADGGRDDRSG